MKSQNDLHYAMYIYTFIQIDFYFVNDDIAFLPSFGAEDLDDNLPL